MQVIKYILVFINCAFIFSDLLTLYFSFLHVLYQDVLPECATELNDLLPTIVGWLIPLSEGTDALAEWSFKLLKLLLIDNSAHLKEAVGKLPPFPDTPQFQEISKIHHKLKYQDKVFSLEHEIQHFLRSAGSTSILASQDTMFDALIFLRKQVKITYYSSMNNY